MKYADFEDIMSAERMGIDSHALLYGLDHVQAVCNKINQVK